MLVTFLIARTKYRQKQFKRGRTCFGIWFQEHQSILKEKSGLSFHQQKQEATVTGKDTENGAPFEAKLQRPMSSIFCLPARTTPHGSTTSQNGVQLGTKCSNV